jgi:hypothetical protein
LVSTRFPDGQRVQIVRPPAVADGQFAFSIRQPRRETGHRPIWAGRCSPTRSGGPPEIRRSATRCVALPRGMAGLPRTGGRRAAQHRLLRHRRFGQDTQPEGLHARDPRRLAACDHRGHA